MIFNTRGTIAFTTRGTIAFTTGQVTFTTETGDPIEIFTTLGVEPFGRYATAIFELIAVVLLLAPVGARGLALGGALTVGLMAGAVGSHLTLLGVEVAGDGGALFGMALVTLFAGAFVTWKRRAELPLPGR